MNICLKMICATLFCASGFAQFTLDVIPYEDLESGNTTELKKALFEKGIVGVRGIPGYRETYDQFIEAARTFASLDEEAKERCAPDREAGDLFLGYERGKERFKTPSGEWVIDDLKVSFYALVPYSPHNKWPQEIDLETPYQEMGQLMAEMGKKVTAAIGLPIDFSHITQTGRMLHYCKDTRSEINNPYWCGEHFDHSAFTALLPASYYKDGTKIDEPAEAGLFVKPTSGTRFEKVVGIDDDVMLFQVGEFGQLASNDAIRATKHRVHKAMGAIERFTMALFFDAPMDTVIHSTSVLTEDSRYSGSAGDPCSYQHWHEESFKRYLVND